jgi:hypothetical protein
MKDEIEKKILKQIKSMEKAESLKESCRDYFYKKFKEEWENEFYKQHLQNLKSECDYLNLKLRLKQHRTTSKDFKKRLNEFKQKIIHCGNLTTSYDTERESFVRDDSHAIIVLDYLVELFPEIKKKGCKR